MLLQLPKLHGTIARFTAASSAPATSRFIFAASAAVVAAATARGQAVAEAEEAPPADILQHYTFGEELGKGGSSIVYNGKCRRTGKAVAIKKLAKTAPNEDIFRREIKLLERLSLHTHITSLVGHYEDDHHYYLVMELVPGGDVFQKVGATGALSEGDASSLLSQLASALAFLHAQDFCHSDLKPENVMLAADGQARLIDFGLACKVSTVRAKWGGTSTYLPPELIEIFGKGEDTVSLPRDLWATGLVAFVMLAGYHPFDPDGSADDSTVQQRVLGYARSGQAFEEYIRPIDGGAFNLASASARSVISSLLDANPKRRLTVEALLQHPWVRDGGGPSRRNARDAKLEEFRLHTSKLRTAAFAVMLQQQARGERIEGPAERARLAAEDTIRRQALNPNRNPNGGRRQRGIADRQSQRLTGKPTGVVDSDLLAKVYRTFDADGKGYISARDMQRVLGEFGRGASTSHGKVKGGDDSASAAADSIALEWMAGAACHDREGQRVTCECLIRTHITCCSLLTSVCSNLNCSRRQLRSDDDSHRPAGVPRGRVRLRARRPGIALLLPP